MKSIGIIAEYDPFHNGHIYQIKKIKEKYPDYIIIVIISTCFTQRGNACLIDKFSKTKMLLENMVDVVVEFPYVFNTQSADTFAKGAVKILNELKIDYLCFGIESDFNIIKKVANAQLSSDFKVLIDNKKSYATSLSESIESITNEKVTLPNDLLAVSYVKDILANKYDIDFLPILRTNSYHDVDSSQSIISASNIRNKIDNNINISSFVPKCTYNFLQNKKTTNIYYNYVKYKILTSDDLTKYVDVNEELSRRLKKYVHDSRSLEDLVKKVKTRKYTYNKIYRMINHIFTCFTKDKALLYSSPTYIRLLGLSKKGKEYIKSIKKDIKLTLINKYISNIDLLNYELYISSLYSLLKEDNTYYESDYKSHTIIL